MSATTPTTPGLPGTPPLRQSGVRWRMYAPNLATYSQPNATTWGYDIKPGDEFWNGSALTAADVASSLQRRAKLGTLTFKLVSSIPAQTHALICGQIHGMYEPPVSGTAALRATKGSLHLGWSITQHVIAANQKNPGRLDDPINNVLARQAFSLALARSAIAKTAFNGTAALPQPRTLFSEPVYPYGESVFKTSQATLPPPDQSKAKANL